MYTVRIQWAEGAPEIYDAPSLEDAKAVLVRLESRCLSTRKIREVLPRYQCAYPKCRGRPALWALDLTADGCRHSMATIH